MSHSKQELIDAAVAIVRERAGGTDGLVGGEYVETYTIADAMEERGWLTHPLSDQGYSAREKSRKSLAGKVKRLLDEEAATPDARVLRVSSATHQTLPRLSGLHRGLYGQAVAYTTPEVWQRATAAVANRQARERAADEEFGGLMERYLALPLPTPTKVDGRSVTFHLDGFRALVNQIEHMRDEMRYLVTGEEST